MTTAREALKISFLENNGLDQIQRIRLKGDASHRQYERIIKNNGETLILMDAPPEKEKIIPFMQVAEFLLNNDLSAPKIMEHDIPNGFMLLEDFGDDVFSSVLSGNSSISAEINETKMYEKAIDALIHLHKIPTNSINLSKYDESMMVRESNLFIDWYISVLNGERINKSVQEEFNVILKHLLSYTKGFSEVVVLRDYHAENLMWLNDNIGHRKVGLLDFQDAVIGSPIYDLVSLLEDARRDVNPQLVEHLISRYLKAFPNYSRKDFQTAYSILGLQRNLKIVGIFARQAAKNKNPYYLSLLPRVWRHINNDLRHPLLLPMKNWLSKLVPTQMKIYKPTHIPLSEKDYA